MGFKLVLIRHGESAWNKENKFTGWTDVGLSAHGREEALEAAELLKQGNFSFSIAFTSYLLRAISTCSIVLENMGLHYIPVVKNWRLNERHYGALEGLNKSETAAKHGEDKVKIWRRSFDIRPPSLEPTDPRFPGNKPAYRNVPKDFLPTSEALADCIKRVLPYWTDAIAPAILRGEDVLIVAHGNSIRSLVKYLDNMSDAEIMEINIPTGVPLVYTFDNALKVVDKRYLLDEAEVKKRVAAVAAQGAAKK
uniref:Phosphoglycerate mutase n=1 Tax=Dermatophagoides pteronyssinus TaxID=6956 RepID=A0A6P6Y619_DERPT|nr:uncharacterized protein LOC113794532 [Dermatophagoides pteronyssinus]